MKYCRSLLLQARVIALYFPHISSQAVFWVVFGAVHYAQITNYYWTLFSNASKVRIWWLFIKQTWKLKIIHFKIWASALYVGPLNGTQNIRGQLLGLITSFKYYHTQLIYIYSPNFLICRENYIHFLWNNLI